MTVPAITVAPESITGPGAAVTPGTTFAADILARTGRADYHDWLRSAASAHGCSHPVRLHGKITDVDSSTGEVLHRLDTASLPDGVIYKSCGTRRASICPACAETYRADTYQLIRAGLAGGKGIPETVSAHPAVFATFTAPSFGHVHARIPGPGGKVLRCRPRRKMPRCPHGRPMSCPQRHTETDPRLGKPLCQDCYDYPAAVVWNAHAPELWRRTMIAIRRRLDRQARDLGIQVRVSYAKVAEFQARGSVHFHAIIRLDGIDPADPARVVPPPLAFTSADLTAAIQSAVAVTWFSTVAHPARPAGWAINWGQPDIRPIRSVPGGQLTSTAVAGYLAKYATKATEPVGTPAVRITSDNLHAYATSHTHQGRLIRVSWKLGGHDHEDFAALRRWAHMLGYRGHFCTRSRRYSITMRAVRAIRANWQRSRHLGHSPRIAETTATFTDLTWTGTGWRTTGDALLALSAAARARERTRIAREETCMN